MPGEKKPPEKIGEFLVKIGAMKPWQVEDILIVQKSGDTRMFGELAIAFGYVDDKALMQYVESHARDEAAAGST